MTVRELKEILKQFPDHLIVMIPNAYVDYEELYPEYAIPAKNVYRGVNEEDGCLFIDAYEEDL